MARKPAHDEACLACAFLKEITLAKELTEHDIDHVYVSKDQWKQLQALFPESLYSGRKGLVYECGIASLYHPNAHFWFTHTHPYLIKRFELPHEEDQEILVFICSTQKYYGDFVGRIWPAKHMSEK